MAYSQITQESGIFKSEVGSPLQSSKTGKFWSYRILTPLFVLRNTTSYLDYVGIEELQENLTQSMYF